MVLIVNIAYTWDQSNKHKYVVLSRRMFYSSLILYYAIAFRFIYSSKLYVITVVICYLFQMQLIRFLSVQLGFTAFVFIFSDQPSNIQCAFRSILICIIIVFRHVMPMLFYD